MLLHTDIPDDGGGVAFTSPGDPTAHGPADEIARRVRAHGGRVVAVRRPDVPRGGPVAAALRYSPSTAARAGAG